MNSRIKTDVKRIFEYWCELNWNGTTIVRSFPMNFSDEKMINDIPKFAFPCEIERDCFKPYSFVLTTDDSKWKFGFCRHDPKTNTAMVLITLLPWHDAFFRFLAVLAELRRGGVETEILQFLKKVYSHNLTERPATNVKFFYNDMNHFTFEVPPQHRLPSIPENHNLNLYYNFVDPKNMIAVFASMLAERRIIFTSRHLDKLSSCIQAAHAFLYPMVWQHIFIPLLPMKLKDYLSAPMPYLIGVPEQVYMTMMPEELGEVVVLNCDTQNFASPFDDVHELPSEIVSHLRKQLSHSNEHIGDRVSKIFLGSLVQLIGAYRDGVEFRQAKKTFNRETFINSRPSHLRPFLVKMMDLQIFQQFIDERIDMLNTGLGMSDEFEVETAKYSEKLGKRGRNLAFFKTVKDKTSPAVKSAVKSVKESSRGMKTAYKDLKSKFRDVTPPATRTQFRSHLASNTMQNQVDGQHSGSDVPYNVVVNTNYFGGRYSAPSSPIFNKRDVNSVYKNVISELDHRQEASASNARGDISINHLNNRGNTLTLASSHPSANMRTIRTERFCNQEYYSGASANISPTNSDGSSDMNLSQEIQNHPLFKTPTVNTSLPNMSSMVSSISSNEKVSEYEELNKDLISLNVSGNNSFDIEDFDPLNRNARPLPIIQNQANACGSTPINNGRRRSSKESPFSNYNGSKSNSNAFFIATQQNHMQPPPLFRKPPMKPPNSDNDAELLRKYGLDQFTLRVQQNENQNSDIFTTANRMSANSTRGSETASSSKPTGMNNWTTFD